VVADMGTRFWHRRTRKPRPMSKCPNAACRWTAVGHPRTAFRQSAPAFANDGVAASCSFLRLGSVVQGLSGAARPRCSRKLTLVLGEFGVELPSAACGRDARETMQRMNNHESDRLNLRRAEGGYRTFLAGLAPGDSKTWALEAGQQPDSVRSPLWAAALRMGITIRTTLEARTLLVTRPPKPTPRPRQ
jgi:hypothetical protein